MKGTGTPKMQRIQWKIWAPGPKIRFWDETES